MTGKLIAWLLELFRKTPKKQQELENRQEELEEELKEIDESSLDLKDINDHFNK
tara:strand:+ start:1684 stop:1845 length:162 start_codon:yes stop_codon:yes gene_type:complete